MAEAPADHVHRLAGVPGELPGDVLRVAVLALDVAERQRARGKLGDLERWRGLLAG